MIETSFEVNVVLEVRNKDGEVVYRDEGKALIRGNEICIQES